MNGFLSHKILGFIQTRPQKSTLARYKWQNKNVRVM